ncbi:MAG: hypothetical protein GAK45_00981 [Pseudomonas citronellolis]|nr:MAG: hypothetical protein GAK45_00981 [Pseudomonas citronellolis]
MADPRRPGTASPPPTLGEGCTSRYDIDALSEQDGTEFPGAAELWKALHPAGQTAPAEDDAKD